MSVAVVRLLTSIGVESTHFAGQLLRHFCIRILGYHDDRCGVNEASKERNIEIDRITTSKALVCLQFAI